MSLINLDSKVVMGSLVYLLRKVAGALYWVHQQNGKISLDWQGPAGGPGRIGGGCPREGPPDDRVDMEILMAVFKAMEDRPAKAPKA